MADRIAVLREEASEERFRLSKAFDALEGEVKKVTDWRAGVRENPTTAVLVTLGAGMVVGMMSRRGPSPRRMSAPDRVRHAAEPTFLSEVARGVWHEGRNVALLLLTRSLTSMLIDRNRK